LHPRVVVGVSALDWDTDELKTLFSSPVYVDGERARGGAGEDASPSSSAIVRKDGDDYATLC